MAKSIIIHSEIRDSVFKNHFYDLNASYTVVNLKQDPQVHIIKHHYIFMYGNSKSEAIPILYPFKILISV